MRIDAHQHFWRYNPDDYVWMNDDMATLKRDYFPVDLAPLIRAEGIDSTVAVQARQNLAESEFLLALADASPSIRGVVGWVDLCSASVNAQLDRFAAHPRFVGVRHIVHDEPDDDFMLRPEFQRGIEALKEYDLTYDLLLFPRHIPRAIKLVGRFPDQAFVLDHIAKPLIADGTIEPWASDIRELASFENVFCKVSGMVTEASWRRWQPTDFQPYLDIVFDCFGPNRLMFGSDWPVCTLSADYGQVCGLVEQHIGRLPEAWQSAVMGINAQRFYGLE